MHGWTRVSGALALGVLFVAAPDATAEAPDVSAYRETAERLIAAARKDGRAWQRLAEMTDTFGNRPSGSAQLEAALRWAEGAMKADGLENVRLEPVDVPHWVRGHESLELVEPAGGSLVLLGLGGSVGTPEEGLTAEVLPVASFDDLEAKAAQAKGRVVLFNVPYTDYRQTVRYRGAGASRAAKLGAVGILLRSVGLPGLRTPHTGQMNYEDGIAKIPAAAIPFEDAQRLQRIADRGQRVVVRLKMEAHQLPDAPSANVVAEWKGRERPEEIVVIGGHIDSWDVGTGAMDDGGGSMVAWEAARLLKSLDLRPRRTVRVVLFTNEENGLRGGLSYRDRHQEEPHVAALETDSGVFKPEGFGFTGTDGARAVVKAIADLLAPIGATSVAADGGGADIGPLVRAKGVPSLSLDVEGSRYFEFHHTPADTLERLDPAHVAECAASLAVMAYVLADLPDRLPWAPPAAAAPLTGP
jgi:carboxypeptidase Q